MKKTISTEDFIQRARKIHGNKYDYSITVYKGSHNNIEYLCPKHGIIVQQAKSHLNGRGCEKCSYEYRGKKKRINDFVERAIKIHGNKYDYSKVEYKNSKEKVTIICPIHGEFRQTPSQHLQGCGCFKCGRDTTGMKRRKGQEQFIQQAKEIHKDNYSYEHVKYVNSTTPVEITCHKHGDFTIMPYNFLSGKGCMKCSCERKSKRIMLSEEEFIERCKKVHNNKYDYSKVVYTGKENRVTIICPVHGEFNQIAGHHMRGVGCPHCMRSLGEEKIAKWLMDRNIHFEPQYKIKIDNIFCASKFQKIDFYLKDYGVFIEFNGKQHYEPVDYFGGEEQFFYQQERDNALRMYCKEHKIKLIEIPYNKMNDIDNILTHLLTQKSKTMTSEEMKKEFEALYDMMANSNKVENMHVFGTVHKEMMEWMIANKPDLAQEWLNKLESIKWKNYLTPKEAQKIVDGMKPEAPWSREVWSQAMRQFALPTEEEPYFNSCALWTEMNKQHSDHAQILAENVYKKPLADIPADEIVPVIRALAIDLLKDKDGKYQIRKYFNL